MKMTILMIMVMMMMMIKKAWWRFRCLVIWRLGPEKMRGRQPPIMSHPTQNDGDNLHFDDDHAVRDDGGAVDEDGGDV